MPWDVDRAIPYLRANAQPTSTKECAKYTRKAIEAGGIRLINTRHAKDYGPSLTKSGFREVSSTGPFRAGDVAVIQSIEGHSDGHMCMFDGNIWISDFKQFHGFYPGHAYRIKKPIYKIYRHL